MNKAKILVVEDDKAVRNLITTTLETQNYQYHTAEKGSEALLEAVSFQPDVMLLDLGLPDMDGIAIIEKVRGWSALPIIVVSARSEESDKIGALDAGADGKTDRTPKEGANDGRTRIAFNEISFTPLCSTFDFTIAPDWMTMEEIESTFRYFAFYGIDENQNRTLLDFQDMFYEGGCGPEEQPDGSLALHVRYQMPALTELPPVIAIVPYNGDSSAEEPLWAYAIYV